MPTPTSNYLANPVSQYGGQPGQSRGIFDSIGSFFNTALAPVGIKPFSGGPYADAGKLDQAQGAINNYTPINDLGALSGLPQIYSQLAQQNGLADPFSEMMKSQWQQNNPAQGNPGQAPQLGANEWFQQPYTPSQNPNDLSQPTQRYLNQKQSDIGGAHQAAWQNIKANLSARGLGDSNTLAAAQAYLDQAYGGQAQQAETTVRGAEQDRKIQLSEYLANALTQLYNAQRQHSLDQSGIFQNQGALSAAQNNNNMNFFRSLLAPFAAQGVSSFMPGGGGATSGLNAGAGSGGAYGVG